MGEFGCRDLGFSILLVCVQMSNFFFSDWLDQGVVMNFFSFIIKGYFGGWQV